MPTYDYKCEVCGHTFEAFQSMQEDPIRVCPSCGEEKVKRLISAGAGLIFKGSGFYITDYKNKGKKDRAGTDRESKTVKKPETKSENKTKKNDE